MLASDLLEEAGVAVTPGVDFEGPTTGAARRVTHSTWRTTTVPCCSMSHYSTTVPIIVLLDVFFVCVYEYSLRHVLERSNSKQGVHTTLVQNASSLFFGKKNPCAGSTAW